MPTKTITNDIKLSSRRECKHLVDALEKASNAKTIPTVKKNNYEEIKGSQVHKYSTKFK